MMDRRQQRIAFAQFLVDFPNFIITLALALVAESMIVWMDVLDSLGYVLRSGLLVLMGRKLIRDLRYEYNYGSSKVEAMLALLCDGITFGGLIIMIGVCFYNLRNPVKPSDFVLGVIILKVIIVLLDVAFLMEQKKINKERRGTIAQSSYAAYLGALLFDGTAMISLAIAWLFRNNPISWYFTPVVSILLAIYLMYKCIKRFRIAINELTDKTLPEDMQINILKAMTKFYDQYTQLHFVKSHRFGENVEIDLVLSFEADTSYAQIRELKKQLQAELSKSIENCSVNINVY